MPFLHLDIETFSEIDLISAGVYRYAQDPSTKILMAAWAIDNKPVQITTDLTKLPKQLLDPKYTISAFNANFERILLREVLGINIPIERWHCTMIHGFGLGFSGGLDAQSQATGVAEKKMAEGKKLIQKFSRIQPESRKISRWDKDNAPEDWALFQEYCKQDVETERALQEYYSEYPLDPQVWQDWYLDQKINDRGLPVDTELVTAALELADRTKERIMANLVRQTGLANPNSNAQLLNWLREQGIAVNNTQATTIAELLKGKLPSKVKKVLEQKQQLAKSSVSKYEAFQAATCKDQRIRGTLQYLGASRTGRWGGRLVQPQNFPRPPKGVDVNKIIEAVLARYPMTNPLYCLSAALRGVFKAGKGKILVVSDLSGIEGRVLPWLCFFQKKLDAIAGGLDPYIVAASDIFQTPYDEITDDQRSVGKVAELALGYQGGVNALNKMATVYNLPPYSDTEGLPIVRAWRYANQPIVQFWDQCQRAARLAIGNPGKAFPAGRVDFIVDGDFLCIDLPSGRSIFYHLPLVDHVGISFMGTNTYTKKWERITTYGGHFCIAKGCKVLTDRGKIAIELVTNKHKVWDGEAWVSTDGAICNGIQTVIKAHGVFMTPDHLILTTEGWKRASQSEEYNRAACRIPNRSEMGWFQRLQVSLGSTLRLWKNKNIRSCRTTETTQKRNKSFLWLHEKQNDRRKEPNSRQNSTSPLLNLEVNDRSVQTTNTPGLEKLRSKGYQRFSGLAKQLRSILGIYGAFLQIWLDSRPYRQREGILSSELQMVNVQRTSQQQEKYEKNSNSKGLNDNTRNLEDIRYRAINPILSTESRMSSKVPFRKTLYEEYVYDLLNCGPRNRFVVFDEDDKPLVVHNCENITQAVSRDILAHSMALAEAKGFCIVGSVHDELITEQRPAKIRSPEVLSRILATQPPWAEGLPLGAHGYQATRYKKT